MSWYRYMRMLPVLLLAGCGAGTPVDPSAFNPADYVLTTDRSAYLAVGEGEGVWRSFEFTVHATLTNRGGTAVYLERCSPNQDTPIFGVQLAVPAPLGRYSAFEQFYACPHGNTEVSVPPGASRSYTLVIRGPTGRDGITKEPLGELWGAKRLSIPVHSCRGDAACRIPGAGVSEPFTVSVAP